MPIYTDQTIAGNFDPGVPPPLPTTITVVTMTIDDADGDGLIRPGSGDTINGSIVNAVWVGDTVTINGVTITGVTFYTSDGGRFFTPGGRVHGRSTGTTATAVTFVSTSTQFPVGNLGPPCFVAGTRSRRCRSGAVGSPRTCGSVIWSRPAIMAPCRCAGSGSGRFRPSVPMRQSGSLPVPWAIMARCSCHRCIAC